ncbi:MAG: hypothetical protein BGP23_09585 [Lysobacterales bacterium 66-474]|nr:MAG: hypothetical protein ABT18_07050 [Rhodanobacter sp. SCN 66-43]OJY83266.1 MAG: hypothetical protein BGP23_09585 [Xanthomonadales bacterium 66-474]
MAMLRILLSLALASGLVASAAAQTAPPPASAGGAATATPANPYSATVPVAGTSDAQRNDAISAAFTQVLQQVSPGFAATPDMLGQASGYVRDFRYRRAASGNGLELQVDFDPGAVGRLVAANQGGAALAGAAPATGSTAAATAQSGSGTLWVDGIGDSHAFASLLSALRGDSALHDVIPVGAQGDGVLLQVGFSQPLATVLASLAGPGGHLVPATQPHPGADASLHWTP